MWRFDERTAQRASVVTRGAQRRCGTAIAIYGCESGSPGAEPVGPPRTVPRRDSYSFPVAQPGRAPVYEAGGRGFKSCRGSQWIAQTGRASRSDLDGRGFNSRSTALKRLLSLQHRSAATRSTGLHPGAVDRSQRIDAARRSLRLRVECPASMPRACGVVFLAASTTSHRSDAPARDATPAFRSRARAWDGPDQFRRTQRASSRERRRHDVRSDAAEQR